MDEKITFYMRRAWQYLELLKQLTGCPKDEFIKDQVIRKYSLNHSFD